MVSSLLLNPFDWLGELFISLVNLIPQVLYLLYASLACVLDVLQLFFRKLAGLDVYYTKIDGKMVAVSGDIVTNFITGILQPFLPGIDKNGNTYPILSTVFWAMIIFGIIICFACTIVAIIKSHYTYDDKSAKGPMQYVYTAGKAVINMIAVPLIVVLGLWVSQGILTALDTITSISSGSVASQFDTTLLQSTFTAKSATDSSAADSKERTYVYYDIFGYGGGIVYGPNSSPIHPSSTEIALIGSSNQTFSGSLFRTAAYNANRARHGSMTLANKDYFSGAKTGEIFASAEDDEQLAEMIDTAFACHLHLKEDAVMELVYANSQEKASSDGGVWVSPKYFNNFYVKYATAFSKFNVGLVWYYYDLWQFNFIVGFAGVIVCASLFINIVLGLMTRLVMSVGLFLIAPPLFGIAPLDGGEAGKNWRKNFMKQILMAYGSVVGMNIVLLILPYLNEIKFFNIPIADYFATTLFIIVGLITVKAFINVVSELVGGADANKSGGDIAKDVGATAGKAIKTPVNVAKGIKSTAVGAVKTAYHGVNAVKHGASVVMHGTSATASAFRSAGSGILKKVDNARAKHEENKAVKEGKNWSKQMNKAKEAKKDVNNTMSRFIDLAAKGQLDKKETKEFDKLKGKMEGLGFEKDEISRVGGLAKTSAQMGNFDKDRLMSAVKKSGGYNRVVSETNAKYRTYAKNALASKDEATERSIKYSQKANDWAAAQGKWKAQRDKDIHGYTDPDGKYHKGFIDSVKGYDYVDPKTGKTKHKNGFVNSAYGLWNSGGETVSSALGTASDAASPLMENDLVDSYKEKSFHKKEDYSKTSAKNTQEILKELKKLNNQKK